MQELVEDGKVRYDGLSNYPVDLVKRAMEIGSVTSNQLQYNPLERQIEKELMPFCKQNCIGILGWGFLAEGFLTDDFDLNTLDPKDFRLRHKYAQSETYARNIRVRGSFKRVALRRQRSMVDVVLARELTPPLNRRHCRNKERE